MKSAIQFLLRTRRLAEELDRPTDEIDYLLRQARRYVYLAKQRQDDMTEVDGDELG